MEKIYSNVNVVDRWWFNNKSFPSIAIVMCTMCMYGEWRVERKQCGGKVNYYGKPNLIWQFYERIPNSFEGEWINGKCCCRSSKKLNVVHMRKYSLLTWQFHAERIFYPIDDDIFFSVNKMDEIGKSGKKKKWDWWLTQVECYSPIDKMKKNKNLPSAHNNTRTYVFYLSINVQDPSRSSYE